ncbi:MAG: hypothetical protein U0Z53_02365 [Blastocatellia bacterium]
MKRRTFAITALVLLCAAAIFAQSHPNLTGTWKMNPQKSQFGPNGGPDSIIIKFDQTEGSISEVMTLGGGGERSVTAKYSLDGKEADIQIDDNTAKGSARWEGSSLVIEWKGEGMGFRRKFTLAGDGKTLTVAVHHTRPDGELDETVVMEKQ